MPVLPAAWIPASLRRLRQRMSRAAPAEPAPGRQLREYFQRKAEQQGYCLSHGQLQVIASLAAQADLLSKGAPRSVYLHGAVGRGKSWLLDGFFQALEVPGKRRLHFHDFFARLHEGMFRHRHLPDALAATLDELLAECRVLCFDEFHVHDIGDAMLITRLFQALFARRIFVLVTSNYAPQGLLPNPLYHQRFEPVIRLIDTHMQVLEVGGEQDYRRLPSAGRHQRFTQGCYVWPGTEAQRRALKLPPRMPVQVTVGTRQLDALSVQGRTVAFSFAAICEQATAVADYLALAADFDEWIIEQLPDLSECSIAAQQRFTHLVDVLYDQDKHLLLLGSLPLAECLGGSAADLARTRSRLGQLTLTGANMP